MSKLEALIAELCPNGVIFVKIKGVAVVSIGEFVHKNKQNPNGLYPVYNGGTSYTGFYDDFNRTANKVIISARGANAGFVNRVFVNFWSGNSCYTITVNKEFLNWNFIYFFLKNNENKLLDSQQKGGIPAVSKKQVEDFEIPLPPLPIQEEIVRILDTFTELTAELTAELNARKKQYEYYRDLLLTFGDEVEWKRLGEIAGYSKIRINAINLNLNNYVGVDNLLPEKRGKISSNFVPLKGNYTKYNEGDILIGNIRPYLRKIWLAENKGGANSDVLVISLKNTNYISSKFLFYVLSSEAFFLFNVKYSKGAKMPRGDKKMVMMYKVPLPSLFLQEQIVSTLEKFEMLINDLTNGLPAEIKARQKQYEYYRDKLLNFPEVKA